jgi:DsbC/DsbD-like thiol-disulfide interchange protein
MDGWMSMRIAAWSWTLVMMLLAATAPAQTPAGTELVKASIIADTTAIEPGKRFNVGVLLKIIPNWHVYWSNAGDAGIPTTVNLKLPDGFTAGPLQYPTPRRFEQTGGIIMFGYADEVLLVTTVTPPAALDPSNVHIDAEVNYLVCDKTCVPGDAKMTLDLPVGAARPDHAELFKTWADRMPAAHSPLLKDATATAALRGGAGNMADVAVTVQWNSAPPADVEWFPPASDALLFSNIKVEPSANNTTRITAAVERLPGLKIGSNLDSVVAGGDAAQRVGVIVPLDLSAAKWNDPKP